jgi:hypothetical protein
MSHIYMPRQSGLNSIPHIWSKNGKKVAEQLLVIHAISGCDTTSALHNHGKGTTLRKLPQHSLQCLTSVMSNVSATQDQIADAGCQLLVAMYGGRVGIDNLNCMWYTMFMSMSAARRTHLLPENSPPDRSASHYH